MNVTQHFTWEEVTRSATADAKGIDNSLPSSLRKNVERTAQAMELVRAYLGGKPLKVNSWFRCPALNKAIGGSLRSVHPLGLAVDFEAPEGMTNEDAFLLLGASDIMFDQLIHERTRSGADWIHFGLRADGEPRRKTLAAAGSVLGGVMSFRRVALG